MNQSATEQGPEASDPTGDPSPSNSDEPQGAAAATLADGKLTVEELEASRDRERWLRRQFEKEHQVLLAMMRLLVSGVSTEGRLMRFWRWLIDDYRSERRLLENSTMEREDEKALVGRLITWFRRGRVESGSDGDATFSGRGS